MGGQREIGDLVEKRFESYPDVAADIINVLLYDGERCVKPENLLAAPTETVYRGAGRLRNQYQDLAKYEFLCGALNMIYKFVVKCPSTIIGAFDPRGIRQIYVQARLLGSLLAGINLQLTAVCS